MTAIAAVICQCLTYLEPRTCDCLDRHMNFEREVEDLRKKVKELKDKRDDILGQLPTEDNPERWMSRQVYNWLRDVEGISDKMTDLEEKARQVSYLLRCCLGKDVRRMVETVNEIERKLPQGQAISATLPTNMLEDDDTVKQEILEYLMSDNNEFGMIGVYGKGRVGQTTIMQHIKSELRCLSRFDRVIWVTVSHPLDVGELQRRIARQIEGRLQGNRNDEQLQASSLMDMRGTRRYALILENVPASFNLDHVGIPKPTINNKWKLVIISRSLNVCTRLGCKVVHVERISKQDSWQLFLNKVGLDDSRISGDLRRILSPIVDLCAGSPLAVIVIAASMKGVSNIEDWKTAREVLFARVRAHKKGSHDQILEILKFSYERLEDSKTQNCLLSCSLYPEDCEISKKDLIENWMDMGLLEELGTRQAMYEEGHRILDTLENNCQLETLHLAPGSVKMHSPIRNMALHIKSTAPRFMVEAGLQLMEMPKVDKWTDDLEKVSLMNNNISEITPNMSPRCPKLSTLMLQANCSLKKIPDNFFDNMPCLQFLDLSRTAIEALPTSICALRGLTSLLLRECDNLKKMPSLAQLGELKKLDLWEAGIEDFPESIKMLENLQYLDLYCPKLVVLPAVILSRLSCLRHLVLYWRSINVKIRGSEVAKMGKLENFEGQLWNLQDFNKYVKSRAFERLSNYALAVGPDLRCWKFMGEDRSKRVSLSGCAVGGDNFVELPDDLQELNVRECNNLRSLSDDSISLQNKTWLRSCGIEICKGIEFVVDMVSSSSSFINNLEDLKLSELPNLLVLVKVEEAEAASTSCAPTLPQIFSNLKTFEIKECPKMKTLFPFELLQGLRKLQYIRVEHCKEMEEIIGSQVDQNQMSNPAARFTAFQELSQLHLMHLPKLKKICSEGGEMVCNSLKSITIEKCQDLETFPILVLRNGQPISSDHARFEIRLDSEKLVKLMKRNNPNSENLLLPLVKVPENHQWRSYI